MSRIQVVEMLVGWTGRHSESTSQKILSVGSGSWLHWQRLVPFHSMVGRQLDIPVGMVLRHIFDQLVDPPQSIALVQRIQGLVIRVDPSSMAFPLPQTDVPK